MAVAAKCRRRELRRCFLTPRPARAHAQVSQQHKPPLTMPPKMDPNEVKIVYVRVTGGEVPGASSLALLSSEVGRCCAHG